MLNMADEKGQADRRRPIARCSAAIAVGRAIAAAAGDLRAATARRVSVDTHAIPGHRRATAPSQGAILLLHDASSETSLEQRCQSLHEKATRDPLTQVANRAEFDRVHEMFVERTSSSRSPAAC